METSYNLFKNCPTLESLVRQCLGDGGYRNRSIEITVDAALRLFMEAGRVKWYHPNIRIESAMGIALFDLTPRHEIICYANNRPLALPCDASDIDTTTCQINFRDKTDMVVIPLGNIAWIDVDADSRLKGFAVTFHQYTKSQERALNVGYSIRVHFEALDSVRYIEDLRKHFKLAVGEE